MNSTYLWHKVDDVYTPIPYSTVFENLNAVAAYFYEMGLEKGDRIAMVLDNCPEYYYIDQAMMKLGLVNASVYPTVSEKDTAYILNDSGAKMVFVGNTFLLNKVRKVRNECPELKTIVTMFDSARFQQEDASIISYDQVVAKGKANYARYHDVIERIFQSLKQDDIATLIYTSGTTGIPKGAILSHGNFISNVVTAKKHIPQVSEKLRFLSFLPLSHVYERMATYYLSTFLGAEVAFAQGIETVAKNMAEISPSIILCVPRLLERVHERIMKSGVGDSTSAKIFRWSMDIGETYRKKKETGAFISPALAVKHKTADLLVFRKIRAKLGGKLDMIVSGGGALPQHIGEFFGNIGMRALEGYGLTETSPVMTINEYHRPVFGTAGRVMPEQTIAIQDIETGEIIARQSYDSFDPEYESGEGEILLKGPNVMQGYWNKPEETAQAIDQQGWFHTGDIGKYYKGNLKITDRLKNMLKTSLGKNIYPTPIENTYLQSHKIDQIFLVGDRREYVSAIVIPNPDELKRHFNLGDDYFDAHEPMIHDPKVIEWLEEDIKKLSNSLAKYERVKTFAVKRRPFSLEEGEMTPTQKIKRRVVEEKYKQEIEGLYV